MNENLIRNIVDLIEDTNFIKDDDIKRNFEITIKRLKDNLNITEKDIKKYYNEVLNIECN